MTEIGGRFGFKGTATITPTLIQFNTSANGTIAALGSYSATFAGQILANANGDRNPDDQPHLRDRHHRAIRNQAVRASR